MKQGRDGETKSHRLAKERFRLIKYLKGNVPAHAFTKATATSGVSVAYGAECDVVTPTFSPADLQAANAALNAPTTEAASPMTSSASNITPPYPAAFMAFVELTVVAACKFVAVKGACSWKLEAVELRHDRRFPSRNDWASPWQLHANLMQRTPIPIRRRAPH